MTIAITLSLTAIVQAHPDNLGMFKGRKRSELPDNYREINTPAKLEAFRKSLDTRVNALKLSIIENNHKSITNLACKKHESFSRKQL